MSEPDVDPWEELEAEYQAVLEERVERQALLELARRAHDARGRALRLADEDLRRATDRARRARAELEEATELLEAATRLVARERR